LAVISKFNSLPVVIFILALIAIVSIRRRDAFALPMAALSCVSVSAWWLVRNAVLYGSPLAQGAANRYLTRLIPGLVHPVGWLNFSRFGQFVPRQLLSTAWYDGGWNQFTLPLWMNYALAALAILSLVCGGLVALGVLRADNDRLSPWAGCALVLTVLGGFVAVIIIAKDTIQAEGRVAYVGLSAFATLCVAGLAWTGRSRRWSRHLCIWTWPVVLAAVNVFVLFDVVIPFRSL
jgi:hypothetical protein